MYDMYIGDTDDINMKQKLFGQLMRHNGIDKKSSPPTLRIIKIFS